MMKVKHLRENMKQIIEERRRVFTIFRFKVFKIERNFIF